VLILSRGGGAVEELACFNDERVVRAVANCSIPVITGIGHHRDESLVDLVADESVHTPTAAAERVVPALADLYNLHWQRVVSLQRVVHQQLERAENQLQGLRERLQRLRLDKQLQQQMQALTWKRQQLIQVTTSKFQQATQHLEMLRQKLVTLDPKAVLQRGYAVVRQENGSVVRNAAEVAMGQELLIQLGQGEIIVKVMEKRESEL
ncbi:MAG: exodeoxyribonuclease VII large subunit, partial [Fischerella sp.]|nr:exodeoxyribonuclease VII large subunit [Fischerella sp.]